MRSARGDQPKTTWMASTNANRAHGNMRGTLPIPRAGDKPLGTAIADWEFHRLSAGNRQGLKR